MIVRSTCCALLCLALVHAAPARADAVLPASAAAPAPVTPAPPAPSSRWPRAVIARQLTLPEHLLQLGLDASANHDASTVAVRPSVGFGLTDKLEVGVGYAYPVHPFEGKGALDGYVGYAIVRGALDGKLEIIARATAGYNVLTELANPLQVGVQVQYGITSRLAVISNSLNATGGGGQLSIGLAGDVKPIKLVLPLALAYQVTPALYLQLDTTLATIKIKDAANAFFGADSTPLALTAIYNAIPAVDVIGGISVDPDISDSLAFGVGVRYYGGAL
jgi:hypothetical protein